MSMVDKVWERLSRIRVRGGKEREVEERLREDRSRG